MWGKLKNGISISQEVTYEFLIGGYFASCLYKSFQEQLSTITAALQTGSGKGATSRSLQTSPNFHCYILMLLLVQLKPLPEAVVGHER